MKYVIISLYVSARGKRSLVRAIRFALELGVFTVAVLAGKVGEEPSGETGEGDVSVEKRRKGDQEY